MSMNFGFSQICRAVVAVSCGMENAGAEQVEAGAAVHGPLDGLDAVHLALDRARGPGQVEGGRHRPANRAEQNQATGEIVDPDIGEITIG